MSRWRCWLPLEASSGQVVRHRLSRRRLNHALYMMAMVQIRRPTAGQAYYRRKRAEGKSPKEELRCLKRRLSDAVYRCLVADRRRQPDSRGPASWATGEFPFAHSQPPADQPGLPVLAHLGACPAPHHQSATGLLHPHLVV
jgi:transposase